jgi:ribose transport system substrate-binding protein
VRDHLSLRGSLVAALSIALAALTVPGAGSASSSATGIVAQAKARLTKLAKPSDAIGKPKSTPKWKRGENIWVISCDEGLTGCAIPAASLKKASKQLDWDVTVFDGHSNPAEWGNGITQAIAGRADAIVLDSVDCGSVKGPLEQAKAAGIVTFGLNAIDCDEPGGGGGRGLIDFVAAPKGYRTHAQFIRDWGRMKADYVIAKTNGRAKVITFTEGDLVGIKLESQGVQQEFAKCKTCKVVANVGVTLQDLATGGVFKKFQTALLQHPEANSVVTLYDAIIVLAVSPALRQAGRTKMIVAGGEGDPASLSLIRSGKGQSCAFAVDIQDSGYPIADNLIRLLAHKRPVDEAVGVLLIDKQHNLNRIHGYYNGFFPYAKYYAKLWRNAK